MAVTTGVEEIGYLDSVGNPVLIYSSATSKTKVDVWFVSRAAISVALTVYINGLNAVNKLLGSSFMLGAGESILLKGLEFGIGDLLYGECGGATASMINYIVMAVKE